MREDKILISNAGQIGWNAVSKKGAVAAGGADAVSAGIQILDQGGNAADAAAGTILALNVTDHGACSIGGEVPVIVYDAKNKEVKTLSGQGRAPLSEEAIEWYMKNGIPKDDIKMAPVPSVVDLCITLLQQYGTKSFEEIVLPTLELLDGGHEEWHPRLAVTLRRMIEEEKITNGTREEKLQGATNRFYGRNGVCQDIANDLEGYYIEKGGFLRKEDLAAHSTLVENPVIINYRGYTICKCGPWTQGPYLCQAMRLLEDFDLKKMGYLSADYIHVVIESIKLAMADRDEYYADPSFVDVPIQKLLSDEYTEIRRRLIDRNKASVEVSPGDPYSLLPIKEGWGSEADIGGTTTCVIADNFGNVISATPSANVYRQEFPMGGPSGVSYGNRLLSLNTNPGHPNCIQPGKRPRITLTPTIVMKTGIPILAVSVAGGDLQDQTTLNLLLNFIEFDMLPNEAVTAPRFATAHHQDSFNPIPNRLGAIKQKGSLTISKELNGSLKEELLRRGHHIETTESPIGTPVMLYIDPKSGFLHVAGDPEAGRHAAGVM